MNFNSALFLLIAVTTVLLSLSEGTIASAETKKHKKDKKRQQSVANTPTSNGPLQTDTPVVVNKSDSNNVETFLDVTPAEEHNGKVGKKHRRHEKQRRKERKQAKRVQRKHANTLTKKQEKKQAKKAARKALKKLQKQQHEAGTEIVSFDDIVQERHGGPIPNPVPPVEGTATESHNPLVSHDNPDVTTNEMSERHDQRLQSKLEKKRLKQSRKQSRRNQGKQTPTCETSSDCTHGHCCVEKKGHKYCKPSRKDEGQKCVQDCMCRSGLVCVSEFIVPGKEKGFCRVSSTQLNNDNGIEGDVDVVDTTTDID